MAEKSVQNEIMSKLCRGSVRLFRNNVGLGFQGKIDQVLEGSWVLLKPFRRIKFGLFKGSSDLIGWKSIEITSDMVGSKVAVFTAIEVKKPGKKVKSDSPQSNFLEQVDKSGGISIVARSIEEAKERLGLQK